MSIYEIERKFLLKNENWRDSVSTMQSIEQYYIDIDKVNIYINKNNINIKSNTFNVKIKLKKKELDALKSNINTERKVLRVRMLNKKTILTIKIDTSLKGTNIEVERYININFYELLKKISNKGIEKKRNIVFYQGYKFEIDEFSGNNKGLVMAEVEVSDISEPAVLPEWIGEEVTGNKYYFNDSLANN